VAGSLAVEFSRTSDAAGQANLYSVPQIKVINTVLVTRIEMIVMVGKVGISAGVMETGSVTTKDLGKQLSGLIAIDSETKTGLPNVLLGIAIASEAMTGLLNVLLEIAIASGTTTGPLNVHSENATDFGLTTDLLNVLSVVATTHMTAIATATRTNRSLCMAATTATISTA
jgi:hypothetical protein